MYDVHLRTLTGLIGGSIKLKIPTIWLVYEKNTVIQNNYNNTSTHFWFVKPLPDRLHFPANC